MKSKAIGALALCLTASMPALALEGADVYSQVRSSLVQLVGVGAEGRFYLGSGVALPNGSIVTNCHVTQHAKRLEPFWGNSPARAESQRADVQHDNASNLLGAQSAIRWMFSLCRPEYTTSAACDTYQENPLRRT